MRNQFAVAITLMLAAGAGCDSTAPESTATSCGPMAAIEASASPFYVYMSPGGSDERRGDEANPVATLSGVLKIVRDARPDSDVIVRIRSDRGIYYDQSVIWDYFDPEHNITFEAWPDSLYACFSQGSADTIFFVLKASAGCRTNLHFRRLFVQGYAAGAFRFNGDEHDESGWNGANTIEDCIMQDMGNETQPERHICWGVIDLVNSRHNVVRDCTLSECANANTNEFPQQESGLSLTSGPNLPIIAIYLANHSSCNEVTRCSFHRVKGDAVRIRDDSNENEISYCYFRQTGWTAVCTMWYRYSEGYPSTVAECPSWSNLFHHNRAEGNWLCGESRLFHDIHREPARRCPEPPDGRAYRIRMWANETSSCTL
jgi:hypothetical protein